MPCISDLTQLNDAFNQFIDAFNQFILSFLLVQHREDNIRDFDIIVIAWNTVWQIMYHLEWFLFAQPREVKEIII